MLLQGHKNVWKVLHDTSTHIKLYVTFTSCFAFRATDETDILSLWTNHGSQSVSRQRLFICQVGQKFSFKSIGY